MSTENIVLTKLYECYITKGSVFSFPYSRNMVEKKHELDTIKKLNYNRCLYIKSNSLGSSIIEITPYGIEYIQEQLNL